MTAEKDGMVKGLVDALSNQATAPLDSSKGIYIEGVKFTVHRDSLNRNNDRLSIDSYNFHPKGCNMLIKLLLVYMFDVAAIPAAEVQDCAG